MADALPKQFGLSVVVRTVPFGDVTRGSLGDLDLALAQVSSIPERRQQVDLSIPYLIRCTPDARATEG